MRSRATFSALRGLAVELVESAPLRKNKRAEEMSLPEVAELGGFECR